MANQTVEWTNHALGELQTKDDTKTVIQLSRRGNGGEYFLSIREWWLPRDSEDYRPTKKGVTITEKDIPDFMAALSQMKEYVEEW